MLEECLSEEENWNMLPEEQLPERIQLGRWKLELSTYQAPELASGFLSAADLRTEREWVSGGLGEFRWGVKALANPVWP